MSSASPLLFKQAASVLGVVIPRKKFETFSPKAQETLEQVLAAAFAVVERKEGLLAKRNETIRDLRRSLNTDRLTGVYTFKYFVDNLAEIIDTRNALRDAHKPAPPCTVIFIDVNNLKKLNDYLGYVQTNEVIIQFAEQLKRFLRQDEKRCDPDILARFGGDEFMIIMNGIGHAQAQARMQEFVQMLANHEGFCLKDGRRVRLSAACGCYEMDSRLTANEIYDDANNAIHKASQAMKTAKSAVKKALEQRGAPTFTIIAKNGDVEADSTQIGLDGVLHPRASSSSVRGQGRA